MLTKQFKNKSLGDYSQGTFFIHRELWSINNMVKGLNSKRILNHQANALLRKISFNKRLSTIQLISFHLIKEL